MHNKFPRGGPKVPPGRNAPFSFSFKFVFQHHYFYKLSTDRDHKCSIKAPIDVDPNAWCWVSPKTSWDVTNNFNKLFIKLIRIRRFTQQSPKTFLQLLLNNRLLLKKIFFLQLLLGCGPKVITITIQKNSLLLPDLATCQQWSKFAFVIVSKLASRFLAEIVIIRDSSNKRYKIMNFIFILV